MSNPNPPANAAPAPRWFLLLAVLALAAYAIFLGRNATTAAGGSDSSGYLNSARILASGHLEGRLRVPPEFAAKEFPQALFTPVGFSPFLERGSLTPTYPVGLPLHVAAASKVVGWSAGVLLVELAGAVAAVWLCYLTARELGVRPALAAAGATALGVCPIFIFTSIQPLSDTLAATWILAAAYCVLRSLRQPAWAAVGGVAFSIAVLVRPTNAVLLPMLLVFLGLDWRRLAFLVLGGIPGAAWLGFYNYTLYGHPLVSGYGEIFYLFGLQHAPGAFVDFAKWLGLLLPAVFLVLPLATLFVREFRTRVLAGLVVWFASVIGLFACFFYSHEAWWSLRYLLPGVPALLLLGLLGLEALGRRLSQASRPRVLNLAGAALILWAVWGSYYWTRHFGALHTRIYEDAYADAARAAQKLLPSDSLVLSLNTCGALYAYTDFAILRWEQISPGEFPRFTARTAQTGRALCAVLFDIEEKEVLHERCPGNWEKVGAVRNISLWRLASAAPAPAAK